MTHIVHSVPPRYPSDPAARAIERARLTAEIQQEASLFALKAGRSLKCRGEINHPSATPWHAYETGGCANDGTNCICECHDGSGRP